MYVLRYAMIFSPCCLDSIWAISLRIHQSHYGHLCVLYSQLTSLLITVNVPFVCGCRNLAEALRRTTEGAAMIRTKGEAGTGDVVEAVRHIRTVKREIAAAQAALQHGGDLALRQLAREYGCDAALLKQTAELGRLPVVNFAAGGVATPADAALMMQLGCDGVFVGSGIFKSGDAAKRARAIVRATTHFRDAKVVAECSEGLGEAMVGINVKTLPAEQKLAGRGW